MGLLKVPVKRIVILTVWHLERYGFTQTGELGEELAVFDVLKERLHVKCTFFCPHNFRQQLWDILTYLICSNLASGCSNLTSCVQ